ncbi:hypothetical protein JQK88_32300 [Mesorhizobium caraganae]|uniref:hypothetical protein n=1 Tax=Mesorhizobium caraganae TaxID=483206 RepID=UPI00193A1CF2|nr:hypothetical protein [Mesorhizobium caraganae]MBM2715794.1 hypothetical protein [Mesorhizobium caraganae]
MEKLKLAIGNGNVSAHIRERLFGEGGRKHHQRIPVASERQLAAILAALGQSEVASSLRDIAYAAKIGALPLDEETGNAIRSAARALVRLRSEILSALGLVEGLENDP